VQKFLKKFSLCQKLSKTHCIFASLNKETETLKDSHMSKNENILNLRAALAQQITKRTDNEEAARQIAGSLSADFIELFGELELVLA